MSLQLAAQHLASRGRGPDTMLVHMAPGEVKSLQALARAHGGTLTTNPDTGLPEAGFLSAILPLVAGAALGPAGLGLSAMQAGLAVGAVGTLATGSLRKGLMAGLGAYGGAGLMGSVTGAGNAAAANMASAEAAAAGDLAAQQALVPSGIPVAPVAPVAAPVVPSSAVTALTPDQVNLLNTQFGVDPSALPTPIQTTPAPVTATPQPAPIAATSVGQSGMAPGVVLGPTAPLPPQPIISSSGELLGYESAVAPATPAASAAPAPVEQVVARTPGAPTYEQMRAAGFSDAQIAQSAREYASNAAGTAQGTPFSQATREAMASPVKTGISSVIKNPSQLFTKDNMKYGLAALAPFMLQDQKQATYQGSGPNPYQYEYISGRLNPPVAGRGETQYFAPSYRRLAAGGPVEAMSDRNVQEMFLTNGAQRFAEGGDTKTPQYVYDPVTKTYKDLNEAPPVDSLTAAARRPTGAVYGGNEFGPSPAGDPDGSNAGWSNMTPAQQAAFYAANPTFAAITQFGQGLFGMTPLGKVQAALVPNFVQQQQMIARGIDPFGMAGLTPQQQSNVNQALSGYLESSMNQPSGPAAPTMGFDTAGFGAYGENVAPGASMGNDVAGFGAYGENVAPGGGVEVSGPISSGDVTGVDIGPADAGPGDGAGSAAAGSGSDDLARGGIAAYARGGAMVGAFARGGYNLGDYSDGGRLLKGPGDGVSDSIPASIAGKRPARLADGEFVVPARIVSELGNGSTEAGARKLYAMMDRVQKRRAKTVGKGKVAVNSRSDKLLPA